MSWVALRFQLGLMGLGLFVAVWGGHMTIVGVGNSSPTQMTYKEYTTSQTDAKWLVLDDCFINYAHGVAIETYDEDSGRTVGTDYFVPIYTSGDDSMYVKAFLVVEDPNKIKLIEQSWDADDRWVEANMSRIIDDPVQIKGLARSGLDLNGEDERLLRSLADEVDPNFTIIDRGEEPQGFLGFVVLLAGLGLIGGGGFWLIMSAKNSKKKPAAYPPPARPGAPRPGAPRPQGPRRPGSGRRPGVAAPPHAQGPVAQPPARGQVAPPPPARGPVAPPPPVQAPPPGQRPGGPPRPRRGGSGGQPQQGPSMPRPRRRRPPM